MNIFWFYVICGVKKDFLFIEVFLDFFSFYIILLFVEVMD